MRERERENVLRSRLKAHLSVTAIIVAAAEHFNTKTRRVGMRLREAVSRAI